MSLFNSFLMHMCVFVMKLIFLCVFFLLLFFSFYSIPRSYLLFVFTLFTNSILILYHRLLLFLFPQNDVGCVYFFTTSIRMRFFMVIYLLVFNILLCDYLDHVLFRFSEI